ncbi:MAG TPA: hypothetical protein VGI99_06690, partial [Gemmataceae bacterium]
MGRPRAKTPTYSKYRDGARTRWTDATGRQHCRHFPGEFDSVESRQAYARLLLELDAKPSPIATAPRKPGAPVYVAMLLMEFL